MANRRFSPNSIKSPFNVDDDDIASAFMNSRPSYLAADRLSPSAQEREVLEAESARNNLLEQIRCVEQRTLDSSKRSLGMLIESEKIGIETAEDLSVQREQLKNTEERLDDINTTLKDTQKNINGIKNVFSSIQQWWSTPKSKNASEKATSKPTESSVSIRGTEKSEPNLSKNLSSAVENSQISLEYSSSIHPGLRLRGLDEEESDSHLQSDFRARSQMVNQRVEDDLMNMSSGLSRLKMLAKGLGDEIAEQNEMVDRIQTKADKAAIGITSQNTQMKRLLKR